MAKLDTDTKEGGCPCSCFYSVVLAVLAIVVYFTIALVDGLVVVAAAVVAAARVYFDTTCLSNQNI